MGPPRCRRTCHSPRSSPAAEPVVIVPQIFPHSLRPRCGPSRRIRRVPPRPYPTAEASRVLPERFAQAALFRNQLDRAAELPSTFPMVLLLLSQVEAGAALPVVPVRAVLPGREQDSRPPLRCLLLRGAESLPPSPWNLAPSD